MLIRFRNLGVLSLVALFLIGCGFQPLMTGENESPQRYILKINGSGYSAYKFRRELEKQLALTPKVNDKAYTITVALTESYIATTYGTDATVSRSQVQSTAAYTITDCNKPIAQGTLSADSSYQLNYEQEFATRSAQTAAVERTLIILAEDLAREIALRIRIVAR
jgi:hypothetical protein